MPATLLARAVSAVDPALAERLAALDLLPITFEGRTLARLAAIVNALPAPPRWLPEAERARLGEAVVSACHAARVPAREVRALVDPAAEAWESAVVGAMRPRS